MSELSEFFFTAHPSVTRIQLIEITHPNFTAPIRVQRQSKKSLRVVHEDAEEAVIYQYLPMQIKALGATSSLDQSLEITMGDVGEIVQAQLLQIANRNGYQTKPILNYREYRSDSFDPEATVSAPDWSFDGIDDMADFGNVTGFDLTDSHSYSVWFSTTASGAQYLFYKQQTEPARMGPSVFLQGRILFNLNNNGLDTNDMSTRTATSGFNDGNLHHLVVTFGGAGAASVTFYVDGVLVATDVVEDNLVASVINTSPLLIGSADDGFAFEGVIKDAAQWDVELTAGDAADIFAAGVGANLTSLGLTANPIHGPIRFDETDSTAANGVIDHSGNGDHGTALNGLGTGTIEVAIGPAFTGPIFGPFELEISGIAFNRTGCSFTAKPKQFNKTRTGEIYDIGRFPMLIGFV